MEGADGREKRVEEPAADRCSAEERDEEERTEKRGCGCAYAMDIRPMGFPICLTVSNKLYIK